MLYELNMKNILNSSHVCVQHIASMSKSSKRVENYLKSASRINYFVSDARQTPLPDNSVSLYVSSYFTDVMALRLFFNEVDRLLEDGGLFVHIGPLDYFFQEPTELLSANEIICEFEKANYVTLVNHTVQTGHLESDYSLQNIVYKNWIFVCQKRVRTKVTFDKSLTFSSVLCIHSATTYQIHGGSSKHETYYLNNTSKGLSREVSSSLFKIIMLLDGKKSLAEVFKELKNDFIVTKKDKNIILEYLHSLVKLELLICKYI